MNWKSPKLAPPLAFALALVIAWLSSFAVDRQQVGGGHEAASRRERDPAPASLAERRSSTLRAMERQVMFGLPAVKQPHDAKGMEAALSNPWYSHDPGNMVSYGNDWAREAPEEMLAWLNEDGDRRPFMAYILFDTWAESDLPAAVAAVFTLGDPAVRQQALMSMLGVMHASDPARAEALLAENFTSFVPDQGVPIVADEFFGPAVNIVLGLPASPQRTLFLAGILKSFATDFSGHTGQTDEVRNVWDQASQNLREELVAAGFASGAKYAASFAGLEEITRHRVESVGTPRDMEAFLASHGPAWAQRDLDGALAWTAAHVKGRERFDQSANLFAAAAIHDYPAALEAWRSLPDGYLKRTAAEEITRAVPPEVNDPELVRETKR